MNLKPRFRLQVENLDVRYGNLRALALDSLNVSGNTISLIGHNGSGKSTLLKTILQLTNPKCGTIKAEFLKDGNWTPLVPEDHMVFSPENGAVFSDVSLKNYIELWCRIKHGDAKYYLKGGAEVLDKLELHDLLGRLGRQLSKGQRKRAQIAIGLIAKPTLFLLDEPFDGLDVKQATHLANILSDAAKSMCLLLCSHNLPLIEHLSDNVIVLSDGKSVASGNVPTVCEQLYNPLCNPHGLEENSVRQPIHASLNDAMSAYLGLTGSKLSPGI